MNSRIRGNQGRQNHQTDELANESHAEQTHQSGAFARIKIQHTKAQRARMLHNKMSAAFWKGKSFIGTHRQPSAVSQKLAKLGQRPRADMYGKWRAKSGEGHDHALNLVGSEQERHREGDRQQGHHERECEREQSRQGQEHGRNRGGDHPQQQSQKQGKGQDDRQPRQQNPGDRKRTGSVHAIKPGKMRALSPHTLPSPMQLLAKANSGAPDLSSTLAIAGTKAALDLLSKMPHDGPLLLVPYLLKMIAPLSMVKSRQPARLQAYRNAALASAPSDGRAPVTAKLHALSLDALLARRDSSIDYTEGEQSIAMVRQRILDIVNGTSQPADSPSSASDLV
ncbi:helicase [Burkholderia sp. Ac-20384]|uniref:helicase n=1 Tax=Burkholderia sp. Ac-20384 TaxID=2703902 RepID=UPI0019818F94|nr:helicase [Burkholderia sp. Ac-20384]MBN3825120.1 helicase [Burkholderia sp. Ac-20384]